MRVVLFRNGRPGVAANIPNENLDVCLSDLLGGELVISRVNKHLDLLKLADPGDLPVRYLRHQLGAEPEEIRGDCIVVTRRPDGSIRSVSEWDVSDALAYVRRA